jgi:hypothetical protein
MGRHATFGAAGHDQANLVGLCFWQMALEQQAQREARVAARKIVDEAIALGLAQDRNDAVCTENLSPNVVMMKSAKNRV